MGLKSLFFCRDTWMNQDASIGGANHNHSTPMDYFMESNQIVSFSISMRPIIACHMITLHLINNLNHF